MSHRKWRETKQHPSRVRSGNHLSCCLLSLHFLCDILHSRTVYLFCNSHPRVYIISISSLVLPWIPERRTSGRLRVSRRRETRMGRRRQRKLMEVLGGVELVERRHRARGEAAPPSLRRGREHLGLLGGGIKKKVGNGRENRNSFNGCFQCNVNHVAHLDRGHTEVQV